VLGYYAVFHGQLEVGHATVYPTTYPTLKNVGSVMVSPPYQGKGFGRLLLARVCRDADAENMDLRLTVVPLNNKPLSKDELTAFYAKFGFVPQENTSNMFRVISGNQLYPSVVSNTLQDPRVDPRLR